jgi:hypothetical protein
MSPDPQQQLQKTQKNLNNYSRNSSLVFQMAIIILAGTFGGIKLDALVKWSFPVFTVTLSFLSVILAMYFMLKDLMRKNK